MTPKRSRDDALRIAAGIGIVLVLVLYFASNWNKRAPDTQDGLELLDAHVETSTVLGVTAGAVKGRVRNNRQTPYSSVLIEITIYDSQGSHIADTNDSANNLQPGETWAFSAPVFKQGAASFKVAKLSGY